MLSERISKMKATNSPGTDSVKTPADQLTLDILQGGGWCVAEEQFKVFEEYFDRLGIALKNFEGNVERIKNLVALVISATLLAMLASVVAGFVVDIAMHGYNPINVITMFLSIVALFGSGLWLLKVLLDRPIMSIAEKVILRMYPKNGSGEGVLASTVSQYLKIYLDTLNENEKKRYLESLCAILPTKDTLNDIAELLIISIITLVPGMFPPRMSLQEALSELELVPLDKNKIINIFPDNRLLAVFSEHIKGQGRYIALPKDMDIRIEGWREKKPRSLHIHAIEKGILKIYLPKASVLTMRAPHHSTLRYITIRVTPMGCTLIKDDKLQCVFFIAISYKIRWLRALKIAARINEAGIGTLYWIEWIMENVKRIIKASDR